MTKNEFIKLVNENLPHWYKAEFVSFGEEIEQCQVAIHGFLGKIDCIFNISYDKDYLCIFNGVIVSSITTFTECYNALEHLTLED